MSDRASGVDERRPRGRRAWALDVALALFATGAELVAVADEGTSVPAIGLAVMAGVALVLRRSAPLAVLATTLAAGVVVVALGDEVAGVAGGIALYTVAAMCERRVSLAALVLTAAIAAGLSAATADAESPGVGRVRRDRRRRAGRRHLGARRLRADAAVATRASCRSARPSSSASASSWPGSPSHEERASIARELHDIVAHSVTVMLVGVRGARDVLRSQPDVADETLGKVETSGEQSLVELRRILALLREPAHGAESRPQPSLARARRARRASTATRGSR